MTRRSLLLGAVGTVAMSACLPGAGPATRPAPDPICRFRARTPTGSDIEQGSALHYGRLGSREGLWLVCDRNSGSCADQVFYFDRSRLQAKDGATLGASEAIPVTAPAGGWDAFFAAHRSIPREALDSVRAQVQAASRRDGPLLDLEGITVAPSIAGRGERLFVIAEEPYSLVLELDVIGEPGAARAEITDAFFYPEAKEARGGDANDGLEGIVWSGRPGVFYLAEEGTRPHKAGDPLHFFAAPRLMRCRFEDGRVIVEEPWSARATQNLRALCTGPTHTINALTRTPDGAVAAVDRNGGSIYRVDPEGATVRPWLSLYGSPCPERLDLRTRLAEFPAARRMPYVSIEGIAFDAEGHLWLVDDPAMPEAFRASCLVRVTLPPERQGPGE